MTVKERARVIVSAVLDMCGVEPVEHRAKLEAFIAEQLEEVEQKAAEKAVGVYRQKTAEAGEKVLTETHVKPDAR